jgi:hypothetical protein
MLILLTEYLNRPRKAGPAARFAAIRPAIAINWLMADMSTVFHISYISLLARYTRLCPGIIAGTWSGVGIRAVGLPLIDYSSTGIRTIT